MALRRLTILTFREPHGRWVARTLEHDMSAEGRTRELAIDMVLRLARAHIAHDIRHKREPLSVFGPAPRLFWDTFHDSIPLAFSGQIDDLDYYSSIRIRVGVARHHPTLLRLVPIERTA